MLKTLITTLQQGHQVASGQSLSTPYPAGTIAMQTPFFKARGLDLSCYFQGTLNLSLAPLQFEIVQADKTFLDIKWAKGFAAENFSFLACNVVLSDTSYPCLIYYPHPETKKRHFQSNSLLEVLAPKIDNLHYGDKLLLQYDEQKLRVF